MLWIKIGNILKPKAHTEGLKNDHFHSSVALHGVSYDWHGGTEKKVLNMMNSIHSSYFI